MAKYLLYFKDKAEHDDAYDITGDEYKIPWVGTIPKLVKGAPYFITYNKGVSPSTNLLDFTYTGGTLSVQIESDFPWSATCDENWITLSGANGSSGISILYVTASENTDGPRKAKILLSDEKNRIKFITVRQDEPAEIPSIIYLDNFEDIQYILENSPYNTFQDYMEHYLENPYDMGSNYYSFTNETMEFNGETYYVYEGDLNIGGMVNVQYGLMPTGYTYDMLYNNSMEADYDNRFHPFSYILNSDNDVYIDKETASDNSYVLAKVVR